ncbi:MAG: terminase large subunit [Tannerella sp.]|jgi:phage terminase large subunit-like protein|nr:terminase large subunit [Tannerella sp.]
MKTKPYYTYAQGVTDGKIPACGPIRLACRRFLNDLERDDLVFSREKAELAVSFIGALRHFVGRHAGNAFVLAGWQEFIVANIVGFRWKSTGLRRFTSSYIEVSRKNGKTSLAAALCLFFLVADGEDGAEVLLAANSKDQAKIAFDMCRKFVEGLDPKGEYFRTYRADIFFDRTDSKLKVLASDDRKLDGFNASFGLVDEYHSAPDSTVRDVIKSSMAMRENPHLCTITTAGFDKSLPCYALRTTGVEVLNGIKSDDSLFVAVFTIDEEDDWKSPAVWPKSNPNLGITVMEKYISEQVLQAGNNPSDEVGVRTKNLNQWCNSARVWIPEEYIIQSTRKVDFSKFGDSICYAGVDLGATSDLTAVAFLVVEEDMYYFKIHYYLPEAALIEKPDRELYRQWRRNGALTVTAGNVTDYDYIQTDIMSVNEMIPVVNIGYDAYNATQWAINCTNAGLPLEPYSQTMGNFNRPTKELERIVLSQKAVFDNNEITRECFRNVVLKSDHNGNVKPVKCLDKKKIDGCIAAIQALGIYLQNPQYSNVIG